MFHVDDTYLRSVPRAIRILLADGGVDAGQRVIDDGIFQLVVGILRALFGNLGYRYVGDVNNSLLFLLSVGIFPAEKFLIRVI